MTERILSVPETCEPQRIDKYLSTALNDTAEQSFSRSAVSVLLEEGRITLNGKKAGKSAKIHGGDQIVGFRNNK